MMYGALGMLAIAPFAVVYGGEILGRFWTRYVDPTIKSTSILWYYRRKARRQH